MSYWTSITSMYKPSVTYVVNSDSEFNKEVQGLLQVLKGHKIDIIMNADYKLYVIKEEDPKEMKGFKLIANKAIQQRIDQQKSMKVIYQQIKEDLTLALFSPNENIRELAKIIKSRTENE